MNIRNSYFKLLALSSFNNFFIVDSLFQRLTRKLFSIFPENQLYTKDASKNWKLNGSDGGYYLATKEPSANVVLLDYISTEKWQGIVDFDDHLDDISKWAILLLLVSQPISLSVCTYLILLIVTIRSWLVFRFWHDMQRLAEPWTLQVDWPCRQQFCH